MLLGIDTGGTFTDFVLVDAGTVRVHKVLSTPAAPEQAILQGLGELGLDTGPGLQVVHGSTVATNAVLEGKGVRTVFITNHGLRDLLTIGRQARPQLYQLNPPPINPPVPRELCLETGGRLGADGEVLENLDDDQLAALVARVKTLAPRAVAVNLLFSYRDDRFEQRIRQALPAELFVSLSSRVLPEYREYERGITTWLNASVGPLVKGYLHRLQARIPRARVSVMQSAGGTIAAELAGDEAVHMLLSGPAGGLAGARFIGQQAGEERLLSFDMGGTSTDVALLDGDLRLTSEGRIGPYPVGVPMVDMHTIGAGGGSLARVDAGGLLQVGPESAGADPGPACYGRGGETATVTDANLVLGRLRAEAFLGGGMRLDSEAATRAVGRVAESLGLSLQAAASGIIAVANEHMARALRVMSVQRGVDPAQLCLASFGGAGGLHVCALAEALDMRRALVPVHAGVLSALGMLVAPRVRHASLTVNHPLDTLNEAALAMEFDALAAPAIASLQAEGLHQAEITVHPGVDLRYRGQSYAITVPWQGVTASRTVFEAHHQALYGHTLDLPVELVTQRIRVEGPGTGIALATLTSGAEVRPGDSVELIGIESPVAIYARDDLPSGFQIQGPALITETVSTTWLAPGWRAEVHGSGSLILVRE